MVAETETSAEVGARTYCGLGLAVAAAIVIADQANKLWFLFVYGIEDKAPVAVAPFLDLVMVWNRGISYGLLQQDGAFGRWMLIIFALGVALGLGIWLARVPSRLAAISLGLIIGGAIGNAIDRIAYGAVADFYALHAFGFEWYVFNVADCAVVAGVIGLLYDSFFGNHKKVSNPSNM
ncbi:signal peptidase II [Methyloligella sp. 2.7D]|uniref:signal peptidase II n=1 Tax=unclassified Methyloligella TaxID=2625955 RepID=UPI00157CD89C|nr:signal peptidase II [Methyloligella sp. GL2]QKP78356.1 signal peptidase II [Methyloligella sp. GL2]